MIRIVVVFCACFPLLNFADEAETPTHVFDMSLEQLSKVRVSIASFEKQSILDSPGTVYVVNREEIASYGWRDLKEILASIVNLDYFHQWNWLPGGQRGFTGNFSGSLLLIDGKAVQNILANETFIKNDFPSHKIERVEVLQGANSTLYGGNAAQGVINVVTRLEGHEGDISDAEFIIGEVDTRQFAFTHKTTTKDWVWGLSASVFQSDQDHAELARFATDPQSYSRDQNRDRLRNLDPAHFINQEKNWTLNARLKAEPWYAGANVQLHTSDKGLEKVRVDYGGGDKTNRGFKQFFVGKNFTLANGIYGFTELIHFTEIKEKWSQINLNPEANSYQEMIHATEYSEIKPSERISLKARMHYDLLDKSSFIWGYEGWRQEIGDSVVLKDPDQDGVFTFERTPGWAADKVKSHVDAFFGQYKTDWQFGNNWSLMLTGGLRYHTQSYTNSRLIPRLGFVLKTRKNQAWKLTYGEAFRPPTSFEFEGTEDEAIDSQEMRMFEFNHSGQWSSSLGVFSNSISVYQMTAKNFYERKFFPDPSGGNGKWMTLVSGEHRVEGVEEQLKWRSGNWQGQLSYRRIRPDKEEFAQEEFIADVPESKFKLGVHYLWDEKTRLAVFVDHWSKVKSLSNSYLAQTKEVYQVPAWSTWNVNASFGPYQVGKFKVNASLYIENLFDKSYYHANARGTSPYRFLQAPRNFRAQIKIAY